MTALEIFANATTALCIFLAGRNNVHTWWVGIVSSIAFGFMFFDAKLYADTLLQVFFVTTAVVGWVNWSNKAGVPVGLSTRSITWATNKEMLLHIGIALWVAAAYGGLLYTFTDAYAPWIDSLVLTFSVVGQLLLMQRKIQTWPVWVFVNVLSVPLYASRGLYLTSVLYFAFLINAIWSYYSWKKSIQQV